MDPFYVSFFITEFLAFLASGYWILCFLVFAIRDAG
jgi:hypothetical protein